MMTMMSMGMGMVVIKVDTKTDLRGSTHFVALQVYSSDFRAY